MITRILPNRTNFVTTTPRTGAAVLCVLLAIFDAEAIGLAFGLSSYPGGMMVYAARLIGNGVAHNVYVQMLMAVVVLSVGVSFFAVRFPLSEEACVALTRDRDR